MVNLQGQTGLDDWGCHTRCLNGLMFGVYKNIVLSCGSLQLHIDVLVFSFQYKEHGDVNTEM